jgi:large subunit ribosomal protein L17e
MYAKTPFNNIVAKARADNVRVHFKNTMETAAALKGMSLRRVKKFLNNVLRHTECIPMRRYISGRGRHSQAKQWGVSQGGFPTKSIYAILKILKNAEANAKLKGLNAAKLYLSHIQVNKATTIRRRTFRAHGRIGPYESHPSHIELILSEKKTTTKKAEDKVETK